jgi:hypothetical protein
LEIDRGYEEMTLTARKVVFLLCGVDDCMIKHAHNEVPQADLFICDSLWSSKK